ncbi:MAG TPA: carboxypeptidase regulatory-like domain-containing protein [Solirubrobacterales bacterium]
MCALVLAWALLVPASSGAATGGTIAGTVSAAAGGTPLEGVEVCAFPAGSPGLGGCDFSAANGGYAIEGVGPGDYRVSFESADPTYLDQYYDHSDTWFGASLVSVGEGATTGGIDADLEEAGSISGTVTDAAGGEPIEGIQVCAESSFNSSCATTGADGTYAIGGLSEGSYKVAFRGFYVETGPDEYEPLNYIRQYYDGRASGDDADPVAVLAGEDTPGIDAELEEGAEVAGSVTAAAGGEPLEGVEVCLYSATSGNLVRCGNSDEDGDYLLFGVPGGSYKVGFGIEAFNFAYAPQYYDDEPTLANADVVALSAGTRTNDIDASLDEAGKVAGTVTAAATGAGIESVQVCASPVGSGAPKCASTDPDGEYTIVGVRAGEYTVSFGGTSAYLSQYYSGKASFDEADRITVADAATTSGIDAALQPAGRMEGKVTAAGDGKALSGVEVCAVKTTASSYFPGGVCVYSGFDGTYVLGGLVSGSYDVRFSAGYGEVAPGQFGKRNFLTQYYKGGFTRTEADPVGVTAGNATTGIDAALLTGASISGTVLAGDTGEGIAAYVCALPTVRRGDEACAFANDDGEYALRGLRSGSYKVRFGPGPGDLSYAREFYDDKASRADANPVSVVAGSTTGGIDAELEQGGRITGAVTDADGGAPLAGIEVCLSNFGSCDATAADGSYELEGLATGSYKVRFEGRFANRKYVPVFYHDAASVTAAQKVSVTLGQTTAGVDQEMHEGARVSGTVLDAAGEDPLSNMTVCATEPDTGAGGCDQTDELGEYAIEGLRAADYRVRFSNQGSYPPGTNAKYLPQYFDGVSDPAQATLLSLELGESAADVDAEMEVGGNIDGTVTLASNHSPVSGVGVCLVFDGEEETEKCSFTDGDGHYLLEGIPTGSHRVAFYPGYFAPFEPPNLLRQYYDGVPRLAEATPVAVTADATTHGIDAELLPGGKITGLITAAGGGEPLEGVEACAYEVGGEGEIYACASSNAHGEYAIARLPSGSYKVRFSAFFSEPGEIPFEEGEEPDLQEEFTTQYYSGKKSLATALPVAVTAGGTTAGIDAHMFKPGMIVDEPPDEGEGNGDGGSSSPPPVIPAPVVTPPPAAKPRPHKCRKGFRKKKVHGKTRCVKKHRPKRGRAQR